MSTNPDKLVVISGEYDDWIPLQRIDDGAKIDEKVETISCDTRDFALGWNFKKPEAFKGPNCGLEFRTNEGLSRARRIEQSKAIGDYLIEPGEIVSWLKKLCEKSGGYDEDWRYLAASVDGCDGWDIKYLRFVRHSSGNFMVCNSYWYPIKWRKVLDNLKKMY